MGVRRRHRYGSWCSAARWRRPSPPGHPPSASVHQWSRRPGTRSRHRWSPVAGRRTRRSRGPSLSKGCSTAAPWRRVRGTRRPGPARYRPCRGWPPPPRSNREAAARWTCGTPTRGGAVGVRGPTVGWGERRVGGQQFGAAPGAGHARPTGPGAAERSKTYPNLARRIRHGRSSCPTLVDAMSANTPLLPVGSVLGRQTGRLRSDTGPPGSDTEGACVASC